MPRPPSFTSTVEGKIIIRTVHGTIGRNALPASLPRIWTIFRSRQISGGIYGGVIRRFVGTASRPEIARSVRAGRKVQGEKTKSTWTLFAIARYPGGGAGGRVVRLRRSRTPQAKISPAVEFRRGHRWQRFSRKVAF